MRKNDSIKQFSNTETAAFCAQMALVLKAGVSTTEGISLLLEDSENSAEQEILQAIYSELEMGATFYDSLAKTAAFPEYMLNMVKIGEEAGRLDQVVDELAQYYEREESIKRSISSTVTYPIIMTGMLVVVVIVLITKVLPVFEQVFRQLGTELSGVSKTLVNAGKAISTYSVVFIVILALIAIFVILAVKTEKGRETAFRIGRHISSIRRIFDDTATCRFASGMALSLRSGLTPERSIELASSLVSDPAFAEKLAKCQELMAEGVELSSALYKSDIFSGLYSKIASIGSKTGNMEESMGRIAELYQEDIDTRMNNMLAVVEPTLVIILSVVVGIVLLSVMLPLVGIMSGM